MSAQEEFWNWFMCHESELFYFNPEQEAEREEIFDEIADELQKVHPELSFEFGPNNVPRRQFVISASGIREAFPAVISLVEAAPPLDRWQVIAFRPRRNPISPVEFGGKRIDPGEVQFSLRTNGNDVGIYLFLPGLREDDTAFRNIGYLLLDEALGEYELETRIGPIKMLSPETRTDGDRYPLAELPSRLDELVSQLERRSARIS